MTEIEKSTMHWRWAALLVYLLVCLYDFMFVGIWVGLNRPSITELMLIVANEDDVMVKLEVLKTLTYQHEPFTMKGGGLFHLAFGAILTGSAVGLNK